ncbi:MAG TPA: BTAD domain-containing putative transcriptional regulator [Gaiellaceae bacterium]|nr:BTAD domain-containing putative transcriptional regulator [Gaiellaceae bacterium]
MEFRMLGPLEVEDGGRVLPLRGPRQRALLARLLVSPNEVVPDERLLDELWGDEPPTSGRAALRVRVSQLRKVLGPAIVTRAPGYLLAVDPERIDARRFERLVAEGQSALETEPALAAERLREALSLWRGQALADLAAEPFARAEAGRLDELRLAALTARIEADLALGRHAELVPELEALVRGHPLQERLRRQQMLALYRCGRQADALAAYREGRARLVDELGIEPGEELRELEAAILRQDPGLNAAAAAPVPVAERKLVTVLVAVGGPQAALREELTAAGGRVGTRGRSTLVAAFGLPVAQEDHAERALHTALGLQRRARDVRIGVESGEVLLTGDSGPAGTALSAATSLARQAAPGKTLVGERTIASTRRGFEFGAPEAGGGRPLVRELTLTQARGALVGRTRELEQLLAAYRAAVSGGAPRLVTLVGNAGVGKTRLVTELWDALAAEQPAPLRRSGRCLAHGRGLTYRPLADVLREQLGLLETDAPETIRERLGGRDVLGMTLGLDAPAELHPLTARAQLQAAWAGFLQELAADQPLVVLVEDLHWAHEPLLDLLERVLDDVAGPLLVVGTARPELEGARPSWGRRRDADSIWLEPLAPAEAEQLLSARSVAVPDQLRGVVLERAEGNPFFLEELASSIAEQGAPAAGVPDTVQAVLASRIDLLPPDEKAALQAAAVIGRVFWRGAVRALLDDAAADFALLEARDFVRRRPASSLAGEREFAFKHALTRDVAYATMSDERRARLHAAFARWLEESGGGRDEHAAFLAHHYAEAAELEQLEGEAVRWLRRAGELSIGRYELDEALALLHRSLELRPEPDVELALWRLIGRANALRHDGDPFLAAMLRAIELSPDRETTAELYAELSFETAIRAGMWRRRPARELVDGWIDRALELSRPLSASRARALIARCVWEPAGTASAAREAGEIAEALGDPELRSYALDARGITAWVSGERDLGRAFEERRFELLDRIHDPDHVADIHYAPVSGCVWLGRFEEARRLASRHDEITRGLTAHHRVHGVAVLVEVEELVGDWERIRRELEPRAESTILTNLETPCVRSPRSLYVMAFAEHALGNPERARQLEELADGFGMEGYGHVLETPRLRLALLRGDLATVESLVETPLPDRGWHRGWMLLSTEAVRLDALAALGRREQVERWPRERPGTYVEPFWLRALGRVREDEALVERAVAKFEQLRMHWFAEDTRAALRS